MVGLRLLVADDETIVRDFIRTVVMDEKLPVLEFLEADSGPEAVRIALDSVPDVILLDNRMPGFSGLKACEMILKKEPAIRVVFISAYDEFDCVRQAFTCGARDYLLKPVHHRQVVEILSRIIADRSAGKPLELEEESDSLVKAVKNYIEENIESELQLVDISKAVFTSPYHLSRKFKKITGQALKDYIFARRMGTALELLKNPHLSITEVAVQAGFNSPGYFATCFKAYTGHSPSQYRASLFRD